MRRGPFKSQALETLRDYGVPISTILDVGVQVATKELIQTFPSLKHVLFEPVVEFTDPIRENYKNIRHELVHAAVSDRSGEVSLQVFTIHNDMQISHSVMTGLTGGSGVRSVPMVSLDDHMAKHPEPGPYLLKIDVDGAELAVLAGASETLKKCSVVVIETPKHYLIERLSAVKAAGFELFDLVEPCYYDNAIWQCDAILVRTELLHKHFKRLSNVDFEASKYSTFRA